MKTISTMIILCSTLWLQAQEELPSDFPQESLSQEIDTIVQRRNGVMDVFDGNPGTAAVRGLLMPAGGQIYNKRWWKLPLALGVEGTTLGYLVYTYDRFSFWDTEYKNVVINGDESTTFDRDELILKARSEARSDRELAWVIWAASHIFVAFEAYIDRHLTEFDISDDLTFTPIPSQLGTIPSFTYTIAL